MAISGPQTISAKLYVIFEISATLCVNLSKATARRLHCRKGLTVARLCVTRPDYASFSKEEEDLKNKA
jgi:hypothetical protein